MVNTVQQKYDMEFISSLMGIAWLCLFMIRLFRWGAIWLLMLRVATVDWGMITLDAFETWVPYLHFPMICEAEALRDTDGCVEKTIPHLPQIGGKGHRSERVQDITPELCIAMKIIGAVS